MTARSLLPFFRPQGVVVVGVSTSPEKLGYGLARNLVASGYKGGIHFVGKKCGELLGRRIYDDIDEVPDPVDLAVIIVPSTDMADTIECCGKRGIGAAILISGGFRESGPEGVQLERRCLEIARQYEIRLLGPNCIGVLDTHLPLDTTFLQSPMPASGGIALISHSGAFCAAIIDWSQRECFGFSQLISLGNQADVNETDVLPIAASDPHTHVIVLYLEGVSDGIRFMDAAREATRHKPVIALKAGRSESGQRAAASHTGAMLASDVTFDAAFAKAGVFRAQTTEEVLDWARVLESCPLPRGKNVAILTDAGGLGVMAADALESNQLNLAQLAKSTATGLLAILPAAAGIQNPVDLLASASPRSYAGSLQMLLADPQVDAVMVIIVAPPMHTTESVADSIIPIIQSAEKPVVIALVGAERTAAALERFNQAKVVSYPFAERAASALGILARRAEYLRTAEGNVTRKAFETRGADNTLRTAEDVLSAYGIPTTLLRLARNPEEAATAASKIGFPVVMKIASPDVLHKSDVGGVLLDINSEAEARAGYGLLIERTKQARPEARINGVHVQPQIGSRQEVIIGFVRDPLFGPLVMFGSGGVEAEGIKDVAFALAPLSPAEAEQMLRHTWAGRKLDGFRNIKAADRAAVLDVLIRVSWLAHEHPEIAEIEINPLAALCEGAVAIDTRMRLSD